MITWKVQHAPDCDVTKQRADLLSRLAIEPDNVYLLGAVPEYDEGGDQEAELCTCHVYNDTATPIQPCAQALRGAHLAREALGGYMALEAYDAGLSAALDQLHAYAQRYGLDFWAAVAATSTSRHAIACDMGADCTCGVETL